MVAIVWFRYDLRIEDNPALVAAAASDLPVLPLYINDTSRLRLLGGASRWWLHHSILALTEELHDKYQITLALYQGDVIQIFQQLLQQVPIQAVHWNRRYDPVGMEIDSDIITLLAQKGATCHQYRGDALIPPDTIKTQTGGVFRVFTPYWHNCNTQLLNGYDLSIISAPQVVRPYNQHVGQTLASWQLLPTTPDWAEGLRQAWQPGSKSAINKLNEFCQDNLPSYQEQRNIPSVSMTSFLSPHLCFGELSSRQVWNKIHTQRYSIGRQTFLIELGWREFARYLLYHFPDMPTRPLRSNFISMPWEEPSTIQAWYEGRTGYPIVDAGMRQLWHTGWMHNRIRMVAASFLVKHLLLDWRLGERWFWDTLVDADLASNAMNWQWVAGCGTDAMPYFRIFSPMLQGLKFDPEGIYVKRWVPELRDLSANYIHAPWTASSIELLGAGITLGSSYPYPIVDHDAARKRALEAMRQLRS